MSCQNLSSSEQVSIEEHTSKDSAYGVPACQEEDEDDTLWRSMQTVMEPAKRVRKRGHLKANEGRNTEHPL